METVFLILIGVIVVAVVLLKQFDKVAGRGPKQVTDGIESSNINNDVIVETENSFEKLKQLDSMRQGQLITEEEYKSKKAEILGNM